MYGPQRVATSILGKRPRLVTAGFRRACVLLLVIVAIAASGLFHITSDGSAALVASHSNEFAGTSQEAAGEPCGAERSGEAHDTTCCIASVCSFCLPLISSSANFAPSDAEVVGMQPDQVHVGCASTPRFRPPKLSVNA